MKKYFNYNKFMDQYESIGKDLHVAFNDRPTAQSLLNVAYDNGFSFYNHAQPDAAILWDYFYHYSHKNAKPILHFYFNSITNRNEIVLTYAAVERTFPQYKNFILYNVF